MSDTSQLTRGSYYKWEWPMKGAGAMARHRRLRPIGRAVTQEDVPDMPESAGPIGIQTLDDKTWVIAPSMITAAGNQLQELVEYHDAMQTTRISVQELIIQETIARHC